MSDEIFLLESIIEFHPETLAELSDAEIIALRDFYGLDIAANLNSAEKPSEVTLDRAARSAARHLAETLRMNADLFTEDEGS